MTALVDITLFTDPACPFAFSAEPGRRRLRWAYGDGLTWTTRMIVLTREDGEAEKLAQGAPSLQRRHGMPIDPAPLSRPASSEPACLAFLAARRRAPDRAERLLRALRVRAMAGGLLDDPALLQAAAQDAGFDPVALAGWSGEPETAAALEDDVRAARDPAPAARALDHKLSGPPGERRYSAPSYGLARAGAPAPIVWVPGFNPPEAYEAAIANLAPELPRRPPPDDLAELLAWAEADEGPLATAEVVAITGRSEQATRAELARVGVPRAAGADCYWSPR